MLLRRDLCGNACGLQGQMQCDLMHKDMGKMIIKALDVANSSSASASSYELGMRPMDHGNFDNGLYWAYKNDDTGADEVLFA